MSGDRALPDHVDVLVVGTGIAGLVAATAAARDGADVLCIDAASELGGTTALSGGRVWIPANGRPENAGDTRELALRYLEQIFDTRYRGHIETFVDTVNEVAAFVESASAHRFVICPDYPDYHPNLEGSTLGGRCFDTGLVAQDSLVPEAGRVRKAPSYTPLTHAEWQRWRYPQHFDHDLLRQRRERGILTGGPGLTAALVDGAVRAGVGLRDRTRLVDVLVDDDAVLGAAVADVTGQHRIDTRSVILATGGYDADPDLRARLLPRGLGVSASAPSSRGVALDVASRLNLAMDNLGNGWWMPMVQMEGETVDGVPYPRGLIRERGVPHMLIVNGTGRRCLNESLPYNEFGKAAHEVAQDGSVPNKVLWLVFDEQFRAKYPLPGLHPTGDLPPEIVGADSLADLAARIAIDPGCLEKSVERWNRDCAAGVDTEFRRGGDAYNRYYGDPAAGENPNLGPVDRPPFYAMRVHSGVIGSKGGPVCTVDGVCLRTDGSVVDGLYAAGTAAAFWTADGYPGPGTPLALGMTFGYLAGRHAARRHHSERGTV